MHGMETNALFIDLNPQTGDLKLIGFGGGGSITLEAAAMESGGAVTGQFEGKFVQITPL